MQMVTSEQNRPMELKSMAEKDEEEISAAMQAFEIKVAACRLYHEAPNDIFELFVSLFSDVDDDDGWLEGGLNVLRLVSKRCLQVVESVATRLRSREDAYETLPATALKRCKRIEHIACYGELRSLEGCPDRLKSLYIRYGLSLQSLEPLSACKELENLTIHRAYLIFGIFPLSSCTSLKKLIIMDSKVANLSPLSTMTLLEELNLQHYGTPDTITDLSSLSQFKNLKKLNISHHAMIEDLSPLSQCPDLEELDISGLILIKDLSFFEKGFEKLKFLDFGYLPIDDLSPLVKLQSLEELQCYRIPSSTSLLPLARCCKLKKLHCYSDAMNLEELRETRPDINMCIICVCG